MPQTVTSVEGFVRKIRQIVPEADEVLLYRGHSDRRNYRLLPSLLRKANLIQAEHIIIRELIVAHPGEFSADHTMLDRLARMQHYGLPTRLLDVTGNPLVALYFAAKEDDGRRGEVILFRVKRNIMKFFDSDTASCIANLAQLTHAEKQSLDFTLPPVEFNASPQIDRLLQFIREEKPHFRPSIIAEDLRRVLCVKPKFNSKRIIAQAGACLLFGMTGELDTNPVAGIVIERISINANRKAVIRAELAHFNINESPMFPKSRARLAMLQA